MSAKVDGLCVWKEDELERVGQRGETVVNRDKESGEEVLREEPKRERDSRRGRREDYVISGF